MKRCPPSKCCSRQSQRQKSGDADLSEISTRIWLDEQLWNEVTNRATAEGTTVRELIPQLVSQCLTSSLASQVSPQMGAAAPAGAASSHLSPPSEPGPPVVVLSAVYRCGVCGAEVRLGGVSNHLGKHLKEQQSSEVERS